MVVCIILRLWAAEFFVIFFDLMSIYVSAFEEALLKECMMD